MSSKTYSMCMSIDGFRRNNRYPRDYKIFKHADNGCTGFDYSGGGCPGRNTTPKVDTP